MLYRIEQTALMPRPPGEIPRRCMEFFPPSNGNAPVLGLAAALHPLFPLPRRRLPPPNALSFAQGMEKGPAFLNILLCSPRALPVPPFDLFGNNFESEDASNP